MGRYDAAIIGGGPERLIAAITLVRAGFHVIVLEKASAPGGRATTREFHPGFRASPYTDELPAIPNRLYRSLDLARHGAILAPSPASMLISDSGTSLIFADVGRSARTVPQAARSGFLAFREEVGALRRLVEERASSLSAPTPRRWFAWRRIALSGGDRAPCSRTGHRSVRLSRRWSWPAWRSACGHREAGRRGHSLRRRDQPNRREAWPCHEHCRARRRHRHARRPVDAGREA